MASIGKSFVTTIGKATAEEAGKSAFEAARRGTSAQEQPAARTTCSGEAAERAVSGAGGASSVDWIIEGMAEAVVFAAAWFTVRMICSRGYTAIKTYRKHKKLQRHPTPQQSTGFASAYHGAESFEEASVPWNTTQDQVNERLDQGPTALSQDDRQWIQDLHTATSAKITRDNLRLLEEVQELSGKIDRLALEELHRKLRLAIKMLIEYQQNPSHRTARKTLEQAELAAREVYTNDQSLALSLSALRIRIVITYLNPPRHSAGLDPSSEEKQEDKYQCELYIQNALKHNALVVLSRAFIASRYSEDKRERERVELEARVAFNMILEVISSVHVLEPFEPSKEIIPQDAPEVVLHALSMYCQSGLGTSPLYKELVSALQNWQSTPKRQERLALHCLYRSTNGEQWACNKGWNNLFEVDPSSLYGVSTEGGRVTKISLGANNLDGKLSTQLETLQHLQELALPANKLCGRIPATLWKLPCLQVVALQNNFFTVQPPEEFAPAKQVPRPSDGNMMGYQGPARGRRLCVAGQVEACHPDRLKVDKGEWFMCSWKITNVGGAVFSKGTKLSRVGDEISAIGGAKFVMINELRPGEEQTVSAMQQAPDGMGLCYQDTWALTGQGLDFVGEEDATSESPLISVTGRDSGVSEGAGADSNTATLANTVFIKAGQRRGSSQHSPFYFSGNYVFSSHSNFR
ncbi:unnamed protein product [Scytosiphon promiscuus]